MLEQPGIPLHTNASENDIRACVTKRKISGGTMSEAGRDARDVMLGLMKTCRKLGVSFFVYLGDRLGLNTAVQQSRRLLTWSAAPPDPARKSAPLTHFAAKTPFKTRIAHGLYTGLPDPGRPGHAPDRTWSDIHLSDAELPRSGADW